MNADPTQIAAEGSREKLDRITRSIIGAAQKVSSTLGYGFLEKVYENSLALELAACGLHVAQQKPIVVEYKGIVVGDYIPDLIVEHAVLVEVKATIGLDRAHRQQCLNYLRATGHRVCLLLNFGQARLEIKRLVFNY